MARKQVDIYIDGACAGNPGQGGWGVILKHGEHQKELSGAIEGTSTNNQAELTAAIQAFEALKEPCIVHIHTDSEYVAKGASERIGNWINQGWKTNSGKPVANLSLWQRLHKITRRHMITWVKVAAHTGDVLNEAVDSLAKNAIR